MITNKVRAVAFKLFRKQFAFVGINGTADHMYIATQRCTSLHLQFKYKFNDMIAPQVVRILGKVENTERYWRLALFQGAPAKRKTKLLSAGPESKAPAADPLLVALAYKRQRFYVFSRR